MKHKINIYILLFIMIIGIFILSSTNYLVVYNAEGKVLKYFPVSPGEKFTISFIHSSEFEPWDNTFVVGKDMSLNLREIKVPTTGPGVPSVLEDGWELKIENGNLVYNVTNKKYKSIDFIVSAISPHHLYIKEHDINLVDLAGDWAPIKIILRKGTIPFLKEGLK